MSGNRNAPEVQSGREIDHTGKWEQEEKPLITFFFFLHLFWNDEIGTK